MAILMAEYRVALTINKDPRISSRMGHVPQSYNVTVGIPDFMGAAQPIPHNVGCVLSRGRRGGGGL